MVDRLDPCGEQPIQLGQVGDLGEAVLGELDQELVAHGAEKPFDLAAALGAPGCGVHQLDAQAGARPQQPRVHKGRSVVHVDRAGDATGGQRRAQRYRQPHGVLVEAEPGCHHRPGPVVEEGEQIRLAPAEMWTVQGVTAAVVPLPLSPTYKTMLPSFSESVRMPETLLLAHPP